MIGPLWLITIPAAVGSTTFEGQDFYLGDVHVHTGASTDAGSSDFNICRGSCGALADLRATAESNDLDFMVVTDHVNGAAVQTADDFEHVRDLLLDIHEPEAGFVVIPGAEVWFTQPDGTFYGHRSLMLFGEDAQLSDMTLEDLQPNGDDSIEVEGCADLWSYAARLEGDFGPTLLIAHHPALIQPAVTDWSCHDPVYAPAVEMFSEHGSSEDDHEDYDPAWSGTDPNGTAVHALGLGYKLGFLAGTDSHDTRPGGHCNIDTEHTRHPYGGGLTVVVQPSGESFDRRAVYDAIVARRTYATSGPLVPVVIAFESGGAHLGGMGEAIALPDGQPLDVTVRLPAEYDAAVQDVILVTPDAELPMARAQSGTYTHTIAHDDAPAWLYAEIRLDGGYLYDGAVCDDGGSDDSERVWLSPTWVHAGGAVDLDGDGYTWADGDCHDGDDTIHPGACERCDNGADDNCDSFADLDDPTCLDVGETEANNDASGEDWRWVAGSPPGDAAAPPGGTSEGLIGGCDTGAAGGMWVAGLAALLGRRRGGASRG